MRRLKTTEVAEFRKQLWEVQGKRCALCQTLLPWDEAVLDHDHTTGIVRGVLHRGCNAQLGHIENNAPRNKLTDPVKLHRFLSGVTNYCLRGTVHTSAGTVLYPTFRTDDEKRLLRNKRAKKARQLKKGTS